MSDTILSTLASQQMSVASEDQTDSMKGDNSSNGETDYSSCEVNPYSQPQDCVLSSLTSSPCPEDGGVTGEDLSLILMLLLLPLSVGHFNYFILTMVHKLCGSFNSFVSF